MKKYRNLVVLLALIFVTACTTDEEAPTASVEVPESFTVDIPEQISSSSSGSLSGRLAGDGDGYIEGNEIYESLRFFVHLGERSAEILEFTLEIATALDRENILSLTYTSDEDGRDKRIEIARDVMRGGVSYQYEMTAYDVADNSLALQLLWNTSPVEGIAIMNPYHINREDADVTEDTFIRIDYSEVSTDYDATMVVSISGHPVSDNGDVDNFKMFAGKKGDVVDVMGNSNHPNLVIIDDSFTGGRNYAFVARGDEAADLGVAKLALPPSSVTTSDVLADYSVYSVLEAEIQSAGVSDQGIIDQILQEAHSPAYFNATGFITSGEDNKPASFSDSFVDLSALSPYVPNDVQSLSLGFIE